MNYLKLFRIYDSASKTYLKVDDNQETIFFQSKEQAKIIRDDREFRLPCFKGLVESPKKALRLNDKFKDYKYRFQIKRAIDHRKGEN
jgi:hypothetical protein